MIKTTLHFNVVKKYSVRYDAAPAAKDPPVTSLYVMKSAMTEPYPQAITVTIEAA